MPIWSDPNDETCNQDGHTLCQISHDMKIGGMQVDVSFFLFMWIYSVMTSRCSCTTIIDQWNDFIVVQQFKTWSMVMIMMILLFLSRLMVMAMAMVVIIMMMVMSLDRHPFFDVVLLLTFGVVVRGGSRSVSR